MKKIDDLFQKIKYWFQHCRPAVVIVAVLVICIITASTVAYLQHQSKINNSFTIGKISVEVTETFENDIKSNVSIKNTGNSDAYIRAKILIYFIDKDGNMTGEVPVEGTDYLMSLGNGVSTNWIKASDCYYFKSKVGPGKSTDVLIKTCEQIKTSPAYKDGNRRLVVDIVGEAVQQDSEAIKDAWGKDVIVDNGMLIKEKR